MDWLETTFGIFPDGGNGSTEVLLLAVVLVIVLMLAVALVTWRRAGRHMPARPSRSHEAKANRQQV